MEEFSGREEGLPRPRRLREPLWLVGSGNSRSVHGCPLQPSESARGGRDESPRDVGFSFAGCPLPLAAMHCMTIHVISTNSSSCPAPAACRSSASALSSHPTCHPPRTPTGSVSALSAFCRPYRIRHPHLGSAPEYQPRRVGPHFVVSWSRGVDAHIAPRFSVIDLSKIQMSMERTHEGKRGLQCGGPGIKRREVGVGKTAAGFRNKPLSPFRPRGAKSVS